MESLGVSFVSQIVTPTILVSASGLLLLGLQNKYARIIDRVRSLNEIKQEIKNSIVQERNVCLQMKYLLKRAELLRTAIFCLYVAILFFILASMAIGLHVFNVLSDFGVIIFFSTGLFAMFLGVLHAILDVQNSFRIIKLELKRVQ